MVCSSKIAWHSKGAQPGRGDLRQNGDAYSRAPVVSGAAAVTNVDEREMLALAAAVEADSEHPIAKAIVSGAVRLASGQSWRWTSRHCQDAGRGRL